LLCTRCSLALSERTLKSPRAFWGNGSYLKSIYSTTGVQPRVKCVYVCSSAVCLHLVILCGLITCTFELYHFIRSLAKIPINKLLLSMIVVEVVVKRIVCTLCSVTHICDNLENSHPRNQNSTLKAWHQNESCPGYECISRVPIPCHTHKCVMPQI